MGGRRKDRGIHVLRRCAFICKHRILVRKFTRCLRSRANSSINSKTNNLEYCLVIVMAPKTHVYDFPGICLAGVHAWNGYDFEYVLISRLDDDADVPKLSHLLMHLNVQVAGGLGICGQCVMCDGRISLYVARRFERFHSAREPDCHRRRGACGEYLQRPKWYQRNT